MGVESILNYIKVNERISTSGQPSADQIVEIAQSGYGVIINLAMPDSTGAIEMEDFIAAENGMKYFHIPVPFDSPNVKHLELFIKLIVLLKNEKTWVHCAKNYRVSAFIYHYLVKVLGETEAEAKNKIFNNWQPNAIWQEFFSITVVEIAL
jgi:protein tyrosine phosphatase (PTP) superfamily phosphohydrolase (DUF442 family)